MSAEHRLTEQIMREYDRLGLNLEESPYAAMFGDRAGAERFLTKLRGMQPDVIWWDVFPDIPCHWLPGRPETWTQPYRPLGPFDHQELPTAPALHIAWPRDTKPNCLTAFLAAARAAGWPVHGGGFIDIQNPDWPTLDAMIVLERATSEDRLFGFANWIDEASEASVATIPRLGDEEYAS